VERLRKSNEILPNVDPPTLCDASGHYITPGGVITLDWNWCPNGIRVHQCDFLVFPESDHLDIIFGVEYIIAENLLTVNESCFLPLTPHEKGNSSKTTPMYLFACESILTIGGQRRKPTMLKL